jgi:hypothetical protein
MRTFHMEQLADHVACGGIEKWFMKPATLGSKHPSLLRNLKLQIFFRWYM